jgi:hypothetical protein
MKKSIAKFAVAAAFLAATGAAEARNVRMPSGSTENFVLAAAADGSVCTRDKLHSIQYGTYFYVSTQDMDAQGYPGPASFIRRFGKEIVKRLDLSWQEALDAVNFDEIVSSDAKLQDFGDKLYMRQRANFNAFESETGIDVLTETKATGSSDGCVPAPPLTF